MIFFHHFPFSNHSHRQQGGHLIFYFSCVDVIALVSKTENLNIDSKIQCDDDAKEKGCGGADPSSSSGVDGRWSLSLEESCSFTGMMRVLRLLFVDRRLGSKGTHLMLHLPPLTSRFSASFLYLLSAFFDQWALGVGDAFAKDSQASEDVYTVIPPYYEP